VGLRIRPPLRKDGETAPRVFWALRMMCCSDTLRDTKPLWEPAGILAFAGGGALPSLISCPPGEAREQHRRDANEENTIESSGAADRGDRRAEPADGGEV
jgi:hypothetical protein